MFSKDGVKNSHVNDKGLNDDNCVVDGINLNNGSGYQNWDEQIQTKLPALPYKPSGFNFSFTRNT